MNEPTVVGSSHPLSEAEQWRLVERYVKHYPDDWRLVFRRGDTVLEVTVPEDVWRAFDGIKFEPRTTESGNRIGSRLLAVAADLAKYRRLTLEKAKAKIWRKP